MSKQKVTKKSALEVSLAKAIKTTSSLDNQLKKIILDIQKLPRKK